MKFSEKAEVIRALRLKCLNDPIKEGFFPNRFGQMRKEENVPIKTFHDSDDTIRNAGMVKLIYEDQNPDEQTTEGQMIRGGICQSYEVGKLFIFFDKRRVDLAKVTPEEKIDIAEGWFSEKGELILRS